jgi:hypothetical protein
MVTRAFGLLILSPAGQMEQLLFVDTSGEGAGFETGFCDGAYEEPAEAIGANVTDGAVPDVEHPH